MSIEDAIRNANKDRYDKIVKIKPTEIESLEAKPPIPEQKDYDKGYITRYFARQSNSPESDIIEIDIKKYGKLNTSETGFYKTIELDWKISGDLNSKLTNGIKNIGVLEANQNSINEAEKELPGVSGLLSNLIKYYDGNNVASSNESPTDGTGGGTGGGGGY